jgi:HAD superfamily hydrolase (TIGR01509 family)
MIRLIIFDFAGTLARQAQPDWEEFFAKLRDFSIRVDAPEQRQRFLRTLPEIADSASSWEDFTNRLVVKAGATIEREERERLQDYLERKLGFKLFDDVVEVLALPQKKAILTQAGRFMVAGISGLRDFEIFTPKDTKSSKPDLKAFLAVLEKMQVDPEEAVMVGDSIERDILPAQAIGIKAILIDRAGSAGKSDCDRISSLKELKKFL